MMKEELSQENTKEIFAFWMSEFHVILSQLQWAETIIYSNNIFEFEINLLIKIITGLMDTEEGQFRMAHELYKIRQHIRSDDL